MAAAAAGKEASVLEAALKQRKGRAFFIALAPLIPSPPSDGTSM